MKLTVRHKKEGFLLIEAIMAMGIFVIAIVSISYHHNSLIGLIFQNKRALIERNEVLSYEAEIKKDPILMLGSSRLKRKSILQNYKKNINGVKVEGSYIPDLYTIEIESGSGLEKVFYAYKR